MAYCDQCGADLIPDANFCSECGSQTSLKSRITAIGKKFRYQAKSTLDSVKRNLDEQISSYINQLEQNSQVRIGGVNVPETRRDGVKNALLQFQNKFLEGDPVETATYEEWVNDLPKRLEEHNCIVCFATWDASSTDNIVVCPHCNSGGHRDHLANWIKTNHYCPLCRESVLFSEFIKLSI